MDKKFKIWRFLGTLFLPVLFFAAAYIITYFIFIRYFSNHCEMLIMDETETRLFGIFCSSMLILQIVLSIVIIARSKNLFILIGMILSFSFNLLLFNGRIKGYINYKSKMTTLSNWQDEFKKGRMAAYFINHDV